MPIEFLRVDVAGGGGLAVGAHAADGGGAEGRGEEAGGGGGVGEEEEGDEAKQRGDRSLCHDQSQHRQGQRVSGVISTSTKNMNGHPLYPCVLISANPVARRPPKAPERGAAQ